MRLSSSSSHSHYHYPFRTIAVVSRITIFCHIFPARSDASTSMSLTASSTTGSFTYCTCTAASLLLSDNSSEQFAAIEAFVRQRWNIEVVLPDAIAAAVRIQEWIAEHLGGLGLDRLRFGCSAHVK